MEERKSEFNPKEYKILYGALIDSGAGFSRLQKLVQRTKSIGRAISSGVQSGVQLYVECLNECPVPTTMLLATATVTGITAGLAAIGAGHLLSNPDVINVGNWVAAGSAIGGFTWTFGMGVFESDPDFNPSIRQRGRW